MSALILGLPSKGRLQEQVTRYLGDAGLHVKQAAGARDYRATLIGMPDIDVKLLSAGDIASALSSGDIHLGVTGEDLIREEASGPQTATALLQPLGLGFADVVVALPRAWIDVATMADLDDVCTAFHTRHHRRLRIATKYMTLTRTFFAAHGIADYRIVESLGATEGAPAAGTAEAIVDITTTGATLAANDLKILDDGVILKSQAQLAASLKASWENGALDAAARVTARIAGRELARGSHILRFAAEKSGDDFAALLAKEADCSLLSRMVSGKSAGEHAFLCPRDRLMDALAALRGRGIKESVAVQSAEYLFAEANPIMDRLLSALRG